MTKIGATDGAADKPGQKLPNAKVVAKFAIKKSVAVEVMYLEPSVSRGATIPHGFVKGVFQLVRAFITVEGVKNTGDYVL